MAKSSNLHTSVMQSEVLSFFEGRELKVFFEGTLGLGGHAEAILREHPEIERYIACDLDTDAMALAQERLSPWKEKLDLVHGNFAHLSRYLSERGIKEVDGFFLILGSRRYNSIVARGDLALGRRDR